MTDPSIYFALVKEQVPQLLSQQDRDPLSPSYGSFDRKYWGWKYRDFSDATLQAAALPLAHIWSCDRPDNPYYRDPALLEWILAGINYIFTIQHRDGTFDQCYPYEQAAGNVYEVFEAFIGVVDRLGKNFSPAVLECARERMRTACEFVLTHEENHGNIANHFACYSYVAHTMGRFFNDQRFYALGDRLLERTLSLQSSEGWFAEYDGADPGYESRTVYYLAKLFVEFSKTHLLPMLSHSLDSFLRYCIHPDGSIGGEYGARNTMVCYPASFEILSRDLPVAAACAQQIRAALTLRNTLTLGYLDFDNLIRIATNDMEALAAAPAHASTLPLLPWEEQQMEYYLPKTGLYFRSTPSYYFVMNVRKGGVFKLFDKTSHALVCSDTNYGGMTATGKILSAHLPEKNVVITKGAGDMSVQTWFQESLQDNMSPVRMILLRLAALTLLRVNFFAELFRRYVSRRLFTPNPQRFAKFMRQIFFDTNGIRVHDQLEDLGAFKKLLWTSNATSVHMASSKYFAPAQLPLWREGLVNLSAFLHGANNISVQTEITLTEKNCTRRRCITGHTTTTEHHSVLLPTRKAG